MRRSEYHARAASFFVSSAASSPPRYKSHLHPEENYFPHHSWRFDHFQSSMWRIAKTIGNIQFFADGEQYPLFFHEIFDLENAKFLPASKQCLLKKKENFDWQEFVAAQEEVSTMSCLLLREVSPFERCSGFETSRYHSK